MGAKDTCPYFFASRVKYRNQPDLGGVKAITCLDFHLRSYYENKVLFHRLLFLSCPWNLPFRRTETTNRGATR